MNLFVLHLLGQSFIHSLYITHSVSHSVTQGCNLFLFFLHITQQYKVSNSMQTLSLSLFYPFNCLYYYLFVYLSVFLFSYLPIAVFLWSVCPCKEYEWSNMNIWISYRFIYDRIIMYPKGCKLHRGIDKCGVIWTKHPLRVSGQKY